MGLEFAEVVWGLGLSPYHPSAFGCGLQVIPSRMGPLKVSTKDADLNGEGLSSSPEYQEP